MAEPRKRLALRLKKSDDNVRRVATRTLQDGTDGDCHAKACLHQPSPAMDVDQGCKESAIGQDAGVAAAHSTSPSGGNQQNAGLVRGTVSVPFQSKVAPQVARLHNLQDTCYLNAAIQLLAHTQGVLQALTDTVKDCAQLPVSSPTQAHPLKAAPMPVPVESPGYPRTRSRTTRSRPAPSYAHEPSLPPKAPQPMREAGQMQVAAAAPASSAPFEDQELCTRTQRCDRLGDALLELLTAMSRSTEVLTPSLLLHRLRLRYARFASACQHDAQEALRCVIAAVDDEWAALQTPSGGSTARCTPLLAQTHTTAAGASNLGVAEMCCGEAEATSVCSPLSQLFRGTLVYAVRCLQCDGVQERAEPFNELSLPVLPGRSLEQLLREQCGGSERMRGRDKYYCDECCALTDATRTVRVDDIGSVLVVHMKRDACARGGGTNVGDVQHLCSHLHVPQRLDFSPDSILADVCTARGLKEQRGRAYSLQGVVAHAGRSGRGHYVTYVRSTETRAPTHLRDGALPTSRDDASLLAAVAMDTASADDYSEAQMHPDAASALQIGPYRTLLKQGDCAERVGQALVSAAACADCALPRGASERGAVALAEDAAAVASPGGTQAVEAEPRGTCWLLLDDEECSTVSDVEIDGFLSASSTSSTVPCLLCYRAIDSA